MSNVQITADLDEKSASSHEFMEVAGDGVRLNLHYKQTVAWNCEARFVAVLAGTQAGKTVMGPPWLLREIQLRGPGDYMAVAPTFALMDRKQLPETRRFFEDIMALGKYSPSSRRFRFSEAGQRRIFGNHGKELETIIQFGYGEDPDSLEAVTAKGAWLDEAGQKKFRLESWYAITRRLAIHQGRAFITSYFYNLGWLKTKIWDGWKAGVPEIEVIRFESKDNPFFSFAEWDRAKNDMPAWKFDLKYRAIPTRPAGLIYDSWSEDRIVPDFKIPPKWARFVGIDPGGVNTAALFYAQDPVSGRFVLYREYKGGNKTVEDHVELMGTNPSTHNPEPMPRAAVGGSKSEGQWRLEFRQAGLPVRPPAVTPVELGIDRVYGFHQRGEVDVFESCEGYLTEIQTYARTLDDNGNPTERIEDKETFHFMDAERYILGYLHGKRPTPRTRARPVSLTSPSKWALA